MKLVKTKDAVGCVLCHDMTQIIPGQKKGPVFKKGHIVQEKDIPVFLSIGKENLYVWENKKGFLHENDAAKILCDICMKDSSDMRASEPSEGKIEIFAEKKGLLKINSKALFKLNNIGQMMVATIHGNLPVNVGDKIAGTRIIPLVIEEKKMRRAVRIVGREPLLKIIPFVHKNAAIVTTGSEIKKGLIKDAFGAALKSKLMEYEVNVIGQVFPGDDLEEIKKEILSFADAGADLILCTGGMSVDPDDRTPAAIKACGAKIVSYGAPVLPGAMFLLSYLRRGKKMIPVLGLPGCVMYAARTIFDLCLPRLLCGERLSAKDLSSFGEGGLCHGCKECRYPNCGFGSVARGLR